MAKSLWFAGLLSVVCAPLHAQNQTINGNLTVTGSIEAAGPIDSGDNTLTFGTQGSGFGGALLHQDNSADTFTFFSNRNPASWLWQHSVGIAAMRLDANHQLILYQADGLTPGVTFAPASNSIKLGTHANGTLTADANGVITAGGGFTVAGNLTNSNSSATTSFMGNVGIGTASPTHKLSVAGTALIENGFGNPNVEAAYRLKFYDNGGTYNDAGIGLDGSAGGGERMWFNALSGFYFNYGTAGQKITFDPNGNVGIGTTIPGDKLEVGDGTAAAGFAVFGNASGSKQSWVRAYDKSGQLLGLTIGYGNVDRIVLNGAGNTYFNGGNVGIGTANPGTKLDVVNGPVRVIGNTDSMWNYASYYSQDTGANARAFAFGARGGAFSLSDETAGAIRFTVNPSGNVGIGTTSPVSKLTVAGVHGDTQFRLFSDHYGQGVEGANTALLNLWASEPGWSWTGAGIGNNVVNSGGIVRVTATRGGSYLRLLDGQIALNTIDSTGADRSALFANAGNVGIGTTNPGQRLDVSGVIRSQGEQLWGSGQLQVQWMNQSDGADQKFTELIQQSGQFVGRFVNDAYSAADTWLLVKRNSTSYSVNSVNFPAGNVGIGTTNPTHKLAVAGTIRAQEIIVDNTNWADYVFEDDYRLAPLAEVESHIKAKGHLPGIPSAAEVAEHGVSMGEMQSKLLSKVEELTLHLIEQEKRIDRLEQENRQLRTLSVNP